VTASKDDAAAAVQAAIVNVAGLGSSSVGGGLPGVNYVGGRYLIVAEQVVVELLQQQPLRSDPVERLQQRGQQQLLGWHRWPAFCGIQRAEGGIEPVESLIGQYPDSPQRMVGWDPLLDRDVGEQVAAALPLTLHLSWGVDPFFAELVGFVSKLLSSSASLRTPAGQTQFVPGHAYSVVGFDSVLDSFAVANPWGAEDQGDAMFSPCMPTFSVPRSQMLSMYNSNSVRYDVN
jgi:hypothetical protein